MSIIYNLPLPDVSFRRKKYPEDFCEGDVVAYRRWSYGGSYSTGVMVIGDYKMFLVATNWDGNGGMHYDDIIDERTELFVANEEEKSWGIRFLFDYLYCRDDQKSGLEAILKFVESTFPNENGINRRDKELCLKFMIELPWCVSNVDWNEAKTELWKIAYKEIQDTGLQFNKERVEFFCFLIGVLMIANSTSDNNKLKELLRTFKDEWFHFVWMYALTLGRLMGTDLKNFTGVVHQLDNSVRVPYLHLYLPLIEGNVDKICMYNPSEKLYNLENAIRKMQKVEALERKSTDLDEIYQILFPKHFRQAMADNRPAATIEGLKQEVATKDEQIKTLENKLSTSVAEYNSKYQALLSDFEELAKASVSFDALKNNLLQLSRNTAEQVIAHLLLTFDEDERILKELKKIKKAVRDNDRPTIQHIYENGAVHDDRSTHVSIESKKTDKQDHQLKLEDK